LILPFVLQSAEVMKKTVAHLERYLDRLEGTSKGKVVLATVYGDVHDIGKNLVNTILSNNGYTVYDLGKQVPVNTIIEKAIEVGADAIGLSALLVSTSKQMPIVSKEMHKRGLEFPILVGGAAINRQYGQRISFVGDDVMYEAGVFYCKDAFEGLETMDRLVDKTQRDPFRAQVRADAITAKADKERGRQTLTTHGRASDETADVRSAVRTDVPVPTPPFWGAQVATRIRLDDVVAASTATPCIVCNGVPKTPRAKNGKNLRVSLTSWCGIWCAKPSVMAGLSLKWSMATSHVSLKGTI
jgi:5-methyltetrahydrofolate--homocysteine methyltransferase